MQMPSHALASSTHISPNQQQEENPHSFENYSLADLSEVSDQGPVLFSVYCYCALFRSHTSCAVLGLSATFITFTGRLLCLLCHTSSIRPVVLIHTLDTIVVTV